MSDVTIASSLNTLRMAGRHIWKRPKYHVIIISTRLSGVNDVRMGRKGGGALMNVRHGAVDVKCC